MKKTNTLLVVGGALLVLGACAQESAPTTSPEVTSADSARASAVSTYRAMWEGFAEAGNTSDSGSQLPGQHAAGAALDKLKRSLQSDKEKGLVTKGKPLLDPKVSAADPADAPTKVTITDCGDSTNWLKYRKDTGLLADNVPGGRRLIKAAVDKQPDGTWKVSDYAVHDVGSC
jgi:hypothetical protein